MIAIYSPQAKSVWQSLKAQGLDASVATWDQVEDPREIDALIGWNIPQHVLDQCPHVKWIQSLGAGVDWALSLTIPESVIITRIVGSFGADMAEYAVLAALAWVKEFPRWLKNQGDRRWDRFVVGSLRQKTVGILGAGAIGQEVAGTFRPLVREVRVLARHRPELPGIPGFTLAERDRFLTGLDILVLVIPLTPQTAGMVNRDWLNRLTPGALLVNIARGPVLDTTAVIAALESGVLSSAVLDVFDEEPLPPEHPLWTTPGVIISPHLAGPSRLDQVVRGISENIRRFRAGQTLLGQVDRVRGY